MRALLRFLCLAGIITIASCSHTQKKQKEQAPADSLVTLQEGSLISYCQSCGMPLTEGIYGTNADGSSNRDYCIYCHKDGSFLQECTMEEMIEHCAQFIDEYNKHAEKKITKEEYIEQMKQFFPKLKRWKKQ